MPMKRRPGRQREGDRDQHARAVEDLVRPVERAEVDGGDARRKQPERDEPRIEDGDQEGERRGHPRDHALDRAAGRGMVGAGGGLAPGEQPAAPGRGREPGARRPARMRPMRQIGECASAGGGGRQCRRMGEGRCGPGIERRHGDFTLVTTLRLSIVRIRKYRKSAIRGRPGVLRWRKFCRDRSLFRYFGRRRVSGRVCASPTRRWPPR